MLEAIPLKQGSYSGDIGIMGKKMETTITDNIVKKQRNKCKATAKDKGSKAKCVDCHPGVQSFCPAAREKLSALSK